MKTRKIFALILSVISISEAITASIFAAPSAVTSSDNVQVCSGVYDGQTENSPIISGVTVKVNGVVQTESEIDVTDGDTITVIFEGANFDSLASSYTESNYQLKWGSNTAYLLKSNSKYTVDTENNTVTVELDAGYYNTTTEANRKIGYKHIDDADFTYVYTVCYSESEAVETTEPVINGVEVKVNGISKPEGEVNVKEGDTVTVVYYGENFDSLASSYTESNYQLKWGSNTAYLLKSNSRYTVDTENNTVTVVLDAGYYNTTTEANRKIGYKHIDDADFTYVYTVCYSESEAVETTEPVINGVEVKVNGISKPEGEVNVKEGDTVTVVYYGENFDLLASSYTESNYQLKWGSNTAYLLKSNSRYTVDAENNTVTLELDAGYYNTSTDLNKKIGYKYVSDLAFTYFYTINYCSSIEIDLGERSADTNVRYAETGGVVTEITEDDDKFSVEIGEENLLIEFTEKTADGAFVKSQYFYVDMQNLTATNLGIDSYMYAYDETSIRVAEPVGIRFKSHILTVAKNEEADFVIDEYGFVLATKEYLGENELTLDTEKKVKGVAYNIENGTDVVFDATSDEKHIFTGILTNVPVKNYKTDIVCKTYTKITVADEQFVIYGEAVVGNIYDTAKAELVNNPENQTLLDIIAAYEQEIGIPADDMYE